MSVVAAIREMLAKGLTFEQALTAAEVIESHQASQLEARKANDRARKARQRSRDVTGSHVTSVTPPSLKEKSPPTPPTKENTLTPIGPSDTDVSLVPEVSGTLARRKERVELFQTVVGMWNDMAAGLRLVGVRDITASRQATIVARSEDLVKTYDFPDALAGWRKLMGLVRGSPFLRGERNGFRCDFDFVTRASSFTKIMEGKYEAGQSIGRR